MAGVVTACGSSGSPPPAPLQIPATLPACASIVGQTLTVYQWNSGCLNGETIQATGSIGCKDGRMIYWNAGGWAYTGEPAEPVVDGAVPHDVYWVDCLGVES